MSLGQCRKTVEIIEQARSLIDDAIDKGQWLDNRTLHRLDHIQHEIGVANYYAATQLSHVENQRLLAISPTTETQGEQTCPKTKQHT